MKKIAIFVLTCFIITSCGEKKVENAKLTSFDACSCATVQDMNSDDFKKCKELRADSKFESDFQKCKLAASIGVQDTSRITIQNAANATNLKSANTGAYAIDASTSKLSWFGEKVTGKKHNGNLNIRAGSLTMTDGKLTAGAIVIDMNSITDSDQSGEGKTKLESHLKSEDFFNTAKFGEAKYVITSATSSSAIEYEVKGNLTIKGITKEVPCHLVIAPNGQDINIGGGFQFDRSLFDVRYGSDTFFDNLGNDMIENGITITLDLKAKKS